MKSTFYPQLAKMAGSKIQLRKVPKAPPKKKPVPESTKEQATSIQLSEDITPVDAQLLTPVKDESPPPLEKPHREIKKGPTRKPQLEEVVKLPSREPQYEETLEQLGVYYDDGPKDYLIKNGRQDYIRVRETDLKRHLRRLGMSSMPINKSQALSEIDELIARIQLERSISYSGPLAGYNKGAYEVCGRIILVTDSPRLANPVPGEWPTLRAVIENMLDSEECVQSVYLYGWLKFALQSLYDGSRTPGQALVLAGERECGKSLLQDVFTELFGGRSAKPYQFMTGGTSFNADLFGAEHLKIEDEAASKDIRARRNFGAALKQITANRDQRHHGKNRNAVTLDPFWRISVSLNDEPENLMVLPPLEDGINDKLILLKAVRKPMPMPVGTPREKDVFRQTITRELPAFIAWLLTWEIPAEFSADRYGIKSFHHPALLEALDELAPEIQLMNLIEEYLSLTEAGTWTGTATCLEQALANSYREQAKSLLRNAATCGAYLERLSKKFPESYVRKTIHGVRQWDISLRGLANRGTDK